MSNTVQTFAKTEQCNICRGACCKHMGCHFSPRDFKEISFESLKAEIETKGYISIDWWENWEDGPEYFLRMRNVGGDIIDPSWGGVCVLLTENGCPLSFEERPLGARALQPRFTYDGPCESYYTKEDCKNEWKQYSDILRELVDYFVQKEIEELDELV